MFDNPILYTIDVLVGLVVALIGAYVGAWWGVSMTYKSERKERNAETIAKMEYFSELMADAISESEQRTEKLEKLVTDLESNPYESYWTDKITSQAIEHFQAALKDDIFASFALIYKDDHQRGREAYKIVRRLADNLLTLKEESRKDVDLIKEYVGDITDEIRKSLISFFGVVYGKDLEQNSLLYRINRKLTEAKEGKKNKIIVESRHLFIDGDSLVNRYLYEQNSMPPEQRNLEVIRFLSDCQNRFLFLDDSFEHSSKQLREYLNFLKKNTSALVAISDEIEAKIKNKVQA